MFDGQDYNGNVSANSLTSAATNVLYYRQIQLIVQRQPLSSEDISQLSSIFDGINITVCSVNCLIRKLVQSGWAHQLPLTL
jgi:hypothetical protein